MMTGVMRIESFTKAFNQIHKYFEDHELNAYTSRDLKNIFNEKRNDWGIAKYRNYIHFQDFVEKKEILILNKLSHEKKIWKTQGATFYEIGLTIKKEGYLSYYTALHLHGLSLQIPKTIYVSFDKTEVINRPEQVILEQSSVDKAFSKPQRVSSIMYKSEMDDGTKYVFSQKKFKSNLLGVVKTSVGRITDLERTLIDITVRPTYSGGVFEVLSAYEAAKDKIDLKKLNLYLNSFDYIYPYHQLIGFYLEKVGYKKSELVDFSKKKSNILFYLTYNLSTKKLNTDWNIYYPMGF